MRKTFSLPVAATAAGGGTPPPPPADTVDNIEHSVRFNSADSAYLSRTFSSAGNRKTWTWSGWVKLSSTGDAAIFSAADTEVYIYGNVLRIYQSVSSANEIRTDAVFRDCSAWYHLVIAYDTTQSTGPDRVKIYVNGVEQSLNGSYPAQDQLVGINAGSEHRIGRTFYSNN